MAQPGEASRVGRTLCFLLSIIGLCLDPRPVEAHDLAPDAPSSHEIAGALRHRTGSIATGTVLHAMNNAFASLALVS